MGKFGDITSYEMQKFMKYLSNHKNFSKDLLQKDGETWGWKNVTLEEVNLECFRKAIEILDK